MNSESTRSIELAVSKSNLINILTTTNLWHAFGLVHGTEEVVDVSLDPNTLIQAKDEETIPLTLVIKNKQEVKIVRGYG